MNGQTIAETLLDYTAANSGHDPARVYLGMSRIHQDERQLVDELERGPYEHSRDSHQMLYLGNMLERDILQRLTLAGVTSGARPSAAVADFDSRFRGHPDAVTVQGDLVEIKTSTERKFDLIAESYRIPRPHFQQVQCYMRHGGYERCHVLYFARETGRVHVKTIPCLDHVGRDLDAKARRVLAAFDERRRLAA